MGDPATPPALKLSLGSLIGFQLGLGVVAVILSLVFGLTPWKQLILSVETVWMSLLATAVMLLTGAWMERQRWQWWQALQRLLEQQLIPALAAMPAGALFLIALSAGVFEELLFRGVIQAGLSGPLGEWPALLLASLFFGLAHAMSRAYFLVATLMGVYLGWLFMITGNLLIPIIIHFLYDWAVLHYYVRRHRSV
ncbi:MAG: CPBP family intramembrane glutamic endopeptidase [Wenzhouxiangella sp.]